MFSSRLSTKRSPGLSPEIVLQHQTANVMLADPDLNITFVNPALQQICLLYTSPSPRD